LGATAFVAIGSKLGLFRPALAEIDGQLPSTASMSKPAGSTSFGGLKQVEAGTLNVGFIDAGSSNGPAVILLHGWPYDIHSCADVTPIPGIGRLPRDRSLFPRPRFDTLPCECNAP
jgi:hypothetical protein